MAFILYLLFRFFHLTSFPRFFYNLSLFFFFYLNVILTLPFFEPLKNGCSFLLNRCVLRLLPMLSSLIWENVFSLNVRSYIWSMFSSLFCGVTHMIWPKMEFKDVSCWSCVSLCGWCISVIFLSACGGFTLTCHWKYLSVKRTDQLKIKVFFT